MIRNRKQIFILGLCCILFLILFPIVPTYKVLGAATGYHDVGHTWASSTDCAGCKAVSGKTDCTNCEHTGKIKCTTCNGLGYKQTYQTSSGSYLYNGCTSCGGSGSGINAASNSPPSGVKTGNGKVNCSTCGGDGALSTTCKRCNGKGVNYKCTTSGCKLKSSTSGSAYDYWSTETATPSAGSLTVCYSAPNTYTVAYKGNGATAGSTANSSHTYATDKALTTNGFTRTGYTFLGWSTSSTATSATYTNGQSVKNLTATNGGTVTLYAVWKANSYTIKYDANGGENVPGNQSATYDVKFYLSDTIPTRIGYTFLGWSTSSAATEATYFSEQEVSNLSTMNGASVMLYAVWKPKEYTLSFVPNGGSFTDENQTDIETVIMTYQTKDFCDMSYGIIERKGYVFKGWYTASEEGVCVYDSNLMCTNDGLYFVDKCWIYPDDLTLYAQWEGKEYTVTYDANGGNCDVNPVSYSYGQDVDLSVEAIKDGYRFVGWSTKPNDNITIHKYSMPDEHVTLYAVYSIEVSDIANHTYPEYEKETANEVILSIWENENTSNHQRYELSYEYDANVMVYRYCISSEDTDGLADFIRNVEEYCYEIIAYDNAKNYRILAYGKVTKDGAQPPPPEPPADEPTIEEEKIEYQQTIHHYRYDASIETYVKFATTTEQIMENEKYTPSYLILEGYVFDHMDYPTGYQIDAAGSYIVTSHATTNAYYIPSKYQVIFDTNGGTCDISQSDIYYGAYYGMLPTPEKKGHTFLGWYTKKDGGNQIHSSDKHLNTADIRLYAHWDVNAYNVVYNYWSNGGSAVSMQNKYIDYGAEVDLSVSAIKTDWRFVGWNTNPNAKTGLDKVIMTDEELVLYAIYEKEIHLNLMEQTDDGVITKSYSKTIYNTETEAGFSMEEPDNWTDWSFEGWTNETEVDSPAVVGIGGIYRTCEDMTLYGLYTTQIDVQYDLNGAMFTIASQSLDAYYNASGQSLFPFFMIEMPPQRENYAFVVWEDENGNACEADSMLQIETDCTLKAMWDKHPEIEAYHRYFTLEQAQRGEITEAELLNRVTATDLEDGILFNGTEVIVENYNQTDFRNMTTNSSKEIVYCATDSYGTTVRKPITIFITDTSVKESSKKKYVRFISMKFLLKNEGTLIPQSEGGLEENSVWRINNHYLELLKNTLFRKNTNTDIRIFTKEEISEIKKKL